MNASGQSILAVHPGALGDVVLFGHLLRAVGEGVALVAGGEKARLLEGMGVVRRAFDFDALPMHEVFSSGPMGLCRLPSILGGCRRLVSCFAAGNRTAQSRLASLAGAGIADFLPIRPPVGFDGHLLDCWAEQLALTLPATPAPWPVPPEWRRDARTALRACGVPADAPYHVIHPGAGSQKKCWPLERFLDLSRRIGAEAGRPVVVLGPVEMERWPGAAGEIARQVPVLASPPLATLAGVLAGARSFVGNDSGVSHLSAAAGAPTVAIFQSPMERHFAPRGRRVDIVSADVITEIPVESVTEAVLGTGSDCSCHE